MENSSNSISKPGVIENAENSISNPGDVEDSVPSDIELDYVHPSVRNKSFNELTPEQQEVKKEYYKDIMIKKKI